MNRYTWENSENAELWQHDLFDTIEDCVKDAVENYEYKNGDTIYIGEPVDFGISVDANEVLERLEEDAFEFAGEAAESWMPSGTSKEALNELSKKLTDVVVEWTTRQSLEPCFYQITNIRAVTVEEV